MFQRPLKVMETSWRVSVRAMSIVSVPLIAREMSFDPRFFMFPLNEVGVVDFGSRTRCETGDYKEHCKMFFMKRLLCHLIVKGE